LNEAGNLVVYNANAEDYLEVRGPNTFTFTNDYTDLTINYADVLITDSDVIIWESETTEVSGEVCQVFEIGNDCNGKLLTLPSRHLCWETNTTLSFEDLFETWNPTVDEIDYDLFGMIVFGVVFGIVFVLYLLWVLYVLMTIEEKQLEIKPKYKREDLSFYDDTYGRTRGGFTFGYSSDYTRH